MVARNLHSQFSLQLLNADLVKKSPWIVGLATQTGIQEVCYEMDGHVNENPRLSFTWTIKWIVLLETLAFKSIIIEGLLVQ